MEIFLRKGVGPMVFGMRKNDVTQILGAPDKEFTDDEKNLIWLYNAQKLRLTFYADEDFRLGYIIGTDADLVLFGIKVIGSDIDQLLQNLIANGLTSWEREDYDMVENHFNEANWLILQSEFGQVVKLELGAIINDRDEFDWKYK